MATVDTPIEGDSLARQSEPPLRLAALIAVIAFQLRSVIVGVPPVLPELRSDLHLSFSATGALTAIPVLGLGAAAIPGAILVNRFGARAVVGAATLGLGVAGLLRLTPPLPYSLYFWTAMMSLSVALAQPGITVLVRSWFPRRLQQVSTIYAMALGAGGLAGATLSVYLLAFGGWRGTFAIWALLAISVGIVWIWFAPGRGDAHVPTPHGLGRLMRETQVWHVAALFGCQSLVFYGGLTWIPFLLRGYSQDYLALVLFLYQVTAVPITAVLATIHRPWARSRSWYVFGALLMTAGSFGFLSGAMGLAWLWAPLTGVGGAMMFAGVLALPTLLARTNSEVAGYSALTLTAGYAFSFLGPLIGGVLLDTTHIVTSPFWVISASAAASAVLGATLPRAAVTAPAGSLGR
jgi:CP family cyanate transporter-like MFS transporter